MVSAPFPGDAQNREQKTANLQFACGCFNRLACWRQSGEGEELLSTNQEVLVAAKAKPAGPPPPAKGKGKGKGTPAPPKAKSKASPFARERSASLAAVWKGPKPSEGCKPQRKVNWNPIRQQELLEGSVWARVNKKIDERGHHLLQQETLDKAFMQPIAKPKPKSKSKSKSVGDITSTKAGKNEQRVFAAKEAFIADVLHAQLVKHGLGKLEKLHWILGTPQTSRTATRARSPVQNDSFCTHSSSSSSSSSSDSGSSENESSSEEDSESEDEKREAPNEDTLQTLLTFLRLADGIEGKLKMPAADSSKVPIAAPEKLLQQLLTKVGPGVLLQTRVQAVLSVTRFSSTSHDLERTMRGSVKAARTILNSTAIPILLEGVLVLGNYVNSSSNELGGAAGISLDSIAKLGHTRSVVSDGSQESQKGPQNALCLIVRQTMRSQDADWLPMLISELQGCKSALDLDCDAASVSLKDLNVKVREVNMCWHPYACFQGQLKRFMEQAIPHLEILRALDEELKGVVGVLQRYFAEPKTSTLSSMMRSLSSLLDFLPKPETSDTGEATPTKAPRISLKDNAQQSGCKTPRGKKSPTSKTTPTGKAPQLSLRALPGKQAGNELNGDGLQPAWTPGPESESSSKHALKTPKLDLDAFDGGKSPRTNTDDPLGLV